MRPVLFGLTSIAACLVLGATGTRRGFQVQAPVLRPAAAAAAPRVGQPAPDFTLEDLAGVQRSLREMRGRYLSINFFCGCGVCRRLARAWNAALRRGAKVKVLGVTAMGPADAGSFARSDGGGYTVLLDSYGTVSRRWGSTTCPQSWLIDPRGRVIYRGSAGEPAHVTVARVRALLDRVSGGRS